MDKRTLLAFAIIGLMAIFMNTDIYRSLVGLPTSTEMAEQARMDEIEAAFLAESELIDKQQTELSESTDSSIRELEQGNRNPESADLQPTDDLDELPPEIITHIETDLAIVEFSSIGGGLKSFALKGIKSYFGENVVLFENGFGNLAPSYNLDGIAVSTDRLHFDLVSGSKYTVSGAETTTLIFEHIFADGSKIEKSYSLSGDDLRIDFHLLLEDLKSPLRHHSYGLGWKSGLLPTELDPVQEAPYLEGLAFVGSEIESISLGRKKEWGEEHFKGTVHWVAARRKYFELAIVPLEIPAEQVFFEGVQTDIGEKTANQEFFFEMEFPLEDKYGIDQSFALYFGPTSKKSMESMPESLGKSVMTKRALMMMSFMWPLVKPFAMISLWVFKFLNQFISNFGVIIIIFGILVKVVVWPLTRKSYRSMHEMKQVQPLIAELKKKHANNPKKLQEETMLLYREHKVNPLGGCLPNLLQMPLLFALFFVFRSAYELRGAGFFGWINDLSVPDTIYTLPFTIPFYGNGVAVLPFIFALANVFMMKGTMTDPNQKLMLYFMPIMMLFIFNNMPSGLTLYYTLFTIVGALQQYYSKGTMENGGIPKIAR
jgi:YidC/Oxa1 family membrane protein insertase